MKIIELELNGLNCTSCANKIQKLTNEIDGVSSANLDMVTKKLKIDLVEDSLRENITNTTIGIIKKLEPDVVVVDKSQGSQKDRDQDHHHHENITKVKLYRIIISIVLFATPFLLKLEGTPRLLVYLTSYFIVGYDVIIRALRNIARGSAFDENFLMTLATVGAFIIGEYPEGVAVMLFYQVGELFQGMAVNYSRRSISALLDIRPDYANLERNNEIVIVDPEDVHIGDYIIIKPGEKVPLDGIVVEGSSTLDTSNITGESVPRSINIGDNIISGVVNNHGLLKVQVNKEFGESTIVKILDLVENASSKKAPTENFITKFARYYTPIVVFIALGIGVIPTLLGGDFREWAYKAFVFLVISCPCALVISIPLGFFGGIGGASKAGILVKGGNYLEALNDVDTIVFDKTGTITKGVFKVTEIISYGDYTEEEVLEFAAYGESFSNHPIGKSILDAYNKDVNKDYISEYSQVSGKGILVEIDNIPMIIGNKNFLEEHNIDVQETQSIGTTVYIARQSTHIGTIIVSDELKDNVKEDIKALKNLGIKEVIMLSGDNTHIAQLVGEKAGVDKIYGDLLPQDKVSIFEDIISKKKAHPKTIFVGDGVNDAPVLARADVGIAMGGMGSDAAIEASDIVIMTDEIGKIGTAIKIANKTKKIVTQNIILAIGLKLLILVLGVYGLATMWQAVFADVGVSIIAILNSIRALKVED